MRPAAIAVLAVACLCAAARPAQADATAFLGTASSPAHRPAKGFAVGMGILVLGFEFEWASVEEAALDGAPGLRTGMGNVLVQTPFPIAGMQFYATAGAGGYREQLDEVRVTSVGMNTGGGVKVSLAGPLRVRVDYRVFRLRGNARHPTVQRIYAGLNLDF